VQKDFLAGDDGKARHKLLSEYFARQPLFEKEGALANLRKLSELPYQQTYASQWEDLYKTLTDFEFLEAKCTHVAVIAQGRSDGACNVYGGVYELEEDYRRALENWGDGAGGVRTRRRPKHPIIVTAVDFGQGLVIRCPSCAQLLPFQQEWLGQEIDCPREGCPGWMKVNPFTVGGPKKQ
jgi:hypothetical protein